MFVIFQIDFCCLIEYLKCVNILETSATVTGEIKATYLLTYL